MPVEERVLEEQIGGMVEQYRRIRARAAAACARLQAPCAPAEGDSAGVTGRCGSESRNRQCAQQVLPTQNCRESLQWRNTLASGDTRILHVVLG